MAQWRGDSTPFLVVVAFAGDCLRDRHSRFPFWDSFLFHVKLSDEQTNKQTRLFCFVLATPWVARGSVHSPLCCYACSLVAQKGGNSKSSLVFNKTKIHSSAFKGYHSGSIGVHGDCTTTVSRLWMRLNYRAQQQTRRQHVQALISVYLGRTLTIFDGVTFRRAVIDPFS